MEIVADLHTHTIASGHALNSIQEMVAHTKSLGKQAIAITDHGMEMPGAPNRWYFKKLSQIPDFDSDVLVLSGVEANIMEGTYDLDVNEETRRLLDWVIMSLHPACIGPASLDVETATQIWLKMAAFPFVDMAGHSEQECYKYDYARVTKAFAENHVVVELNAGSALSRPGNEGNLRELALCCKANRTKVAVNSDAHATFELGNEQTILQMLEEIEFPEELVINSSMERLLRELHLHGRPIADRAKKHYQVEY